MDLNGMFDEGVIDYKEAIQVMNEFAQKSLTPKKLKEYHQDRDIYLLKAKEFEGKNNEWVNTQINALADKYGILDARHFWVNKKIKSLPFYEALENYNIAIEDLREMLAVKGHEMKKKHLKMYKNGIAFYETAKKHLLEGSNDISNNISWNEKGLFQFEVTNKYLHNDTNETVNIKGCDVKPGHFLFNNRYFIQNKYAIPLPYHISISNNVICKQAKPDYSEFLNYLNEIDRTIKRHYHEGNKNGTGIKSIKAFLDYHYNYANDKKNFIEYCNDVLKRELKGIYLETLNSWLEEKAKHKGQMNSDFYIKLKGVGYSKGDYPNAVYELEQEYNNLILLFKEYQLQQPVALKHFAITGYNQISEVQNRIADWYKRLCEKELNSLTKEEFKDHQAELDYYHDVLTITDGARGLFLEHLAAFYPEEFEDPQKLELLQKILPAYDPIVKRIVAKYGKLPQQTDLKKPEFENNFDSVSTEKIFIHFKSRLVDSKMLASDELNSYLKAAFENKQPPQTLFSIKNAPSKDRVMKVFYEYYKNIAGKPHGKQKEYAGLLGNYFQGFKTDTVSSNFSKSIY